ncbi:MAG: glycerol kinase GlpK [Acidimicrobiia bacterium]
MGVVLAIDAGTTGVRTMAVGSDGRPVAAAHREFPQYFPEPGRVEHDADEIWEATVGTLAEVVAVLDEQGETVAALGITDQRETTVLWDTATGQLLHRAIVWQDRRTAGRCDALKADGLEPTVRALTGLVLDPYFSGSKVEWLLGPGGVEVTPTTAFGTVDSWLLWKLTGGPDGGVHATEPSNASRTMLFDISTLGWSERMCDTFGVPASILPEVLPSSGRFGTTDPASAAGLTVPVSGIAGDQQAALFGQACFEPGMTKNTYGTGSFVLMNLGSTLPDPVDGLLTTVAWDLGEHGGGADVSYAMEGAIFVTGAAVQWLRDGLGIISDAAETGPLAESVDDTGGVYVVPAFTGLGSPHWDPFARGTIVGLSRGTTTAHIARAVVESMAFQTLDVVEAITAASGTQPSELRIDGGASVMDLLGSFQADVLGLPVRRAAVAETTALGAAYLAGIAEGVWSDRAEAAAAWRADAVFEPSGDPEAVAASVEQWHRAVERSTGWARSGPD